VTVVAVGDTPEHAIEALERSRGPVAVVRRCPELAGLLAACQSGLAQVAVVAADTDALTATLVDRLTAVGVSVVAVAATPAEAARLRSIGAWPLTGTAGVELLTESVLAVVSARRHRPSASFGFPLAERPADVPRRGLPHSTGLPDDALLQGDAGGRPFAGPTAGARGREPDSAAAAGPSAAEPSAAGPFPAGPFPGRASTAGEPADSAAGEPPGQAGGGHAAHIQTRGGGRSGSHAPAPGVLAKVAGRVKSAVAGAQESALAGDPVTRRTLAVWGPIGSPGRTLLAVNMAGELAARGQRVMLVDADSYGASVAASLGLLDESASFAQACRVADQGLLTVAELARICSEVVCAGGTFSLLTGLTRSDRWPELRAAAVERVLQTARTMVDTVVIDCGFCLETDEELSYDTVAPRRNAATLAALAQADTIYAVGSADAVGIPRLIRALADLTEACAGSEVRVVLNKVRKKSAGGSPVKALEDAWQRFGPALPIGHVLPWDPDVPARALLEGQLLQELAPDSALRRAIRDICCAPVQGNHRTAVLSATARPGNPG